MSSPPTSLPAEIAEIMTITTVGYEKSTGVDGYGQSTYAALVDVTCWMENHIPGGTQAWRAPIQGEALVNTTEAQYDLYFDGQNTVAQGFSMEDRFTVPGYPAGLPVKPDYINTMFGPPFDNTNPWLVIVSL